MTAFKLPSAIAILMLLGCLVALSQPATNSPADETVAWQQLQQASVTPPLTKAQTTREQQSKFYVDFYTVAGAKAKAFYTQFPDSTNAVSAKLLECTMLRAAFVDSISQDTRKDAFTAMANAQDALLLDARLTDTQRFDLRMDIAERAEQDPQLDWNARYAAYKKNLRQLIKDYPNNDKAYNALILYAAEDLGPDEMRSIANEILASPASGDTKDKARAVLRRLDAVGKPLDIKFTALDGREVDLSRMKGKVVLVDFWATWCGPCVGEIPHVKEAYEKLHPQDLRSSASALTMKKAGFKTSFKPRLCPGHSILMANNGEINLALNMPLIPSPPCGWWTKKATCANPTPGTICKATLKSSSRNNSSRISSS